MCSAQFTILYVYCLLWKTSLRTTRLDEIILLVRILHLRYDAAVPGDKQEQRSRSENMPKPAGSEIRYL